MTQSMGIAGAMFLVLLSGGALAAPYSSDLLGFSADFPGTPAVDSPAGSEKDETGKFISTSVMVSEQVQGVYMAAVLVDTFDAPHVLDIPLSLANERDSFVKPLNGTVTTSNTGFVDGNQAMFFNYVTPDGSSAGGGIVSIVAGEKPRIYLLVTMHTANASSAQLAALDRFTGSLRIKAQTPVK